MGTCIATPGHGFSSKKKHINQFKGVHMRCHHHNNINRTLIYIENEFHYKIHFKSHKIQKILKIFLELLNRKKQLT